MLKNIKFQLIVMFFMQFAVLGSFIISLGGLLASNGLGQYIGLFYAVSGFVNLLFPTLFGILADRFIPAQKLYGMVHLLLTAFLVLFALFLKGGIEASNIPIAITIFSIISCLYYPTIPLGYSLSFTSLREHNIEIKTVLPPIRMFGTIGFVVAMLLTDLLGVQFSYGQFLVGAFFSFLLFIWSFFLPNCTPRQTAVFGGFFSGFKLFRNHRIAIFFFFVLCVGIVLKLSEAYLNPYFAAMKIDHPNMLISISRISETLCILLVPFSLKFLGVRRTIMIAVFSWALHFGSLAYGCQINAIWPLIIGMAVYGIGFDFFNIAGTIYVDSLVSSEVRSTAQGLVSMFTNGFGVILGAFIGQLLFNDYVFSSSVPDWITPWMLISSGCVVLLLVIVLLRRHIQD